MKISEKRRKFLWKKGTRKNLQNLRNMDSHHNEMGTKLYAYKLSKRISFPIKNRSYFIIPCFVKECHAVIYVVDTGDR